MSSYRNYVMQQQQQILFTNTITQQLNAQNNSLELLIGSQPMIKGKTSICGKWGLV